MKRETLACLYITRLQAYAQWQAILTMGTPQLFQIGLLASFQMNVSIRLISKGFLRVSPYALKICNKYIYFFTPFLLLALSWQVFADNCLKSGYLKKKALPFSLSLLYMLVLQCHLWKLISSRSHVGHWQISFKKENKNFLLPCYRLHG